ncbi:MAG: hypothetical protein IT437_00905 [Phycisphaerales bacterium]|nr:hypothetical protein [Phycisphaerales bacterium]
MPLSRHVLTMFHRRLLLLAGVFATVLFVMFLQLGRLQLAQGAEHRAMAESRLESLTWVQTTRGRILDRKGRVLAQDRPSFDLTVDYRVLSGAWSVKQSGAAARLLEPAAWAAADKPGRELLIDRYRPIFDAHVERAWREIAAAVGLPPAALAEKRDDAVARVKALEASVRGVRQTVEYNAVLARGQELTTEVQDAIAKRVKTPILESESPQILIHAISDEAGFALLHLASQTEVLSLPGPDGPREVVVPLCPGLAVPNSADREYPYDHIVVEVDRSTFPSPERGDGGTAHVQVSGVATNVIGWVGNNARAEDIAARRARMTMDPELREAAVVEVAGRSEDRGSYEDGDVVGRWGVEEGREDQLRGLRGLTVTRRDTGENERTLAPEPGRDVRLTIDAKLQARIQAAMEPSLGLAQVRPWQRASEDEEQELMPDGTPLAGAAVVLDIATGDVLAMVSTPSFTRRDVRDRPDWVFKDPLDMPAIDRTIARPYPPGSIAKAPLLCAAVTLGKHHLEDHIECNGMLNPNAPDRLRCWIYKHFGTTHTQLIGRPLSARDALRVSCNIYFFTVGRKLGPEGIAAAYGMFGVGRGFDLGIGHEEPGSIGAFGRVVNGRRTAIPPTPDDAIQMGIGQGPIVWTPMHATNALATIARGGVDIRPRVIDDGSAPVHEDLHLDQAAVAEAMLGLDDSVNTHDGTGSHLRIDGVAEPVFNAPGVRVWGKTGTADASAIVREVRGPDGKPELDAKGRIRKEVLRDGDHSWFVILAGPSGGEPRYAIGVLMEYAGSGGKVSGPIANQVLHALIAEGYL